MPYELTFDEAHDYGNSDPREGIAVPVTLIAGDAAAHLTASVDTGASFCIFERGYGELLGLDVEAGEPVVLGTATGTFKAYGHAVTLTTLGYSFDVVVYFAAHESFGRNVLGRRGWLDHVRLGAGRLRGQNVPEQVRRIRHDLMSPPPSTRGQIEPLSLQTTLATTGRHEAVLRSAIELWAGASTGVSSRRRGEVLQNKQNVVKAFFEWVKKSPAEVEPTDVSGWCDLMRAEGKRPATIYARVSFLSSFYRWALGQPELGATLRQNPAAFARPKRVPPYQTEATKAWSDEELRAVTDVVSRKAAGEDLVARRDLALLLMYTSTGMRREEIISLKGKDIQVEDDGLVVGGRVKGGRYRAREVRDPEVRAALLDYLAAAKRLHVLKTDAPLWTRHDHPKLAGEALTSHAFVRNLKLYAREAGLDHVHLHQTRHTYARIVSEETGSMTATQDALDHADLSTTAVYVQRIAVKRDLHSAAVAKRRKGNSVA